MPLWRARGRRRSRQIDPVAERRPRCFESILLGLDEPTNHLDLPSIERLEAMLAGYPGALVMVTHDDRLGSACTEEIWRLSEGRLEIGLAR